MTQKMAEQYGLILGRVAMCEYDGEEIKKVLARGNCSKTLISALIGKSWEAVERALVMLEKKGEVELVQRSPNRYEYRLVKK